MLPFIGTSKNFKYLGINLAKDVQVLYDKKCKILLRQLIQNLNKWKICCVYGSHDSIANVLFLHWFIVLMEF